MTTYTPSSDNVMFGRGKVLFSKFENTAFTSQFIHLGNCDTFAIGMAPDKVTLTDFTTETSASYKEVIKKVDVTVKISGFEFATKVLEKMFLGDTTSYTQTAATLTETIGAATLTNLLGSLFTTTKRSISAPVLTQGTATLVSGTDYEIYDASGGVLRILPTGTTIADGTALVLTYVAAAITSTPLSVMRGATQTSLQGRVLFLPDNTTGPDNEVTIWNASLTPDGDVGFIGDDFAKWNISGSVQSDAAGTYGGSTANPYFQILTR